MDWSYLAKRHNNSHRTPKFWSRPFFGVEGRGHPMVTREMSPPLVIFVPKRKGYIRDGLFFYKFILRTNGGSPLSSERNPDKLGWYYPVIKGIVMSQCKDPQKKKRISWFHSSTLPHHTKRKDGEPYPSTNLTTSPKSWWWTSEQAQHPGFVWG